MYKNKVKIIIFVIAALLISSVSFGPVKKAQAWSVLGTGVSYDDIAGPVKEVQSTILMALNRAFVSGFLQKAQDKYKINDYLNYIANVSDKVYVNSQLKVFGPQETYKIMSLIQKFRGNAPQGSAEKLQDLFAKEAAQNAIFSPEQVDFNDPADFQDQLTRATDFLSLTPQGRNILGSDKAQAILATADAAATVSLQSNGTKDRFQCKNISSSQGVNKVSCAVRDPANYLVTLIDSKILRDDKEMVVPNDTMAGFIKVIAQAAANKLAQKILNVSGSNSIINDINLGTR